MFELDFDLPVPDSERAKNYRARRKSKGFKNNSGKGADHSKWAAAQFIALDGEGENEGDVELFQVGDDGRSYTAQRHIYTLLAASTGESLFNNGLALDTQTCIDFLLDLGAEYQKAIFVIFAGGYDINHILMFGFEREILKKISKGENHEWDVDGVTYGVEYRARKSLTLRRDKNWVKDKNNKHTVKWGARIIIWDVFGFFQENFVGVMAKWLGRDHRHFELIKDMKTRRGDFANVAQSKINAYNAAELECLKELMEIVHGAINGLDLKVMRWDGAGSIAAAMFRKHEVKQFKSDKRERSADGVLHRMDNIPTDVALACRCAYAGGRIEICKIGNHEGAVYDYDINSAYPSVMQSVPCLACGKWQRGTTANPPPGFTLVHVRYDFAHGMPFYPLFFRTKMMQISFPSDGEGWYWYPEFDAAQLCQGNLEVIEWWHYETTCDHKPFGWIPDYYETRKKWVKNPDEEWQRGGEKIIKLGLNSLYGKCAQQLGGTDTEPPTYHQLEWAGYITSATRARLFTLAMRDPAAIIGFATDGVFSVRALLPGGSINKMLGEWELKQPVPLGMTIAMAGVYWWHRENNKFDHFSRGFDKDAMMTPEFIMGAWKKGIDTVDIGMHRLIGMGSACASDTLWQMRGRFAVGTRALRLDGYSHKRAPCDVRRDKPHKQLIDLKPKPNAEYGYGTQDMSFPYPLKWACSSGDKDAFENELEIAAELDDTMNV